VRTIQGRTITVRNQRGTFTVAEDTLLSELSKRLAALLPVAENLRAELRTKMEQVLRLGLAELDVLSKHEFSAQQAALDRAQQRVSELEALVEELETKLDDLDATGR